MSRIITANCVRCGDEFDVRSMVATSSRRRGEEHRYICVRCASHNEGYHTQNNDVYGIPKVSKVRIGLEIESSYTDDFARNLLFEYRCKATHDGSLHSDGYGSRYGYDGNTSEYITPIMEGLNIASKLALACDRLITEGHMKINDSCGTHLHVSINNMANARGEKVYNGYIRRYYHSLFLPLNNAMVANPSATASLFGRCFSDYAEAITVNAEPSHNRYLWINMMSDSNIEFRLNRFVSVRQYQNLMKMEVEMVKCIVTNFCEHFNDGYADIDSRRYFRIVNGERKPSKDAYRKHKADVTAKKLVAIYKKYAGI